jgi:hypothetical protein
LVAGELFLATIQEPGEDVPIAESIELRFGLYEILLDVGDTFYALHEHQALLGGGPQCQDVLREPAALLDAFLDLLLEPEIHRADLLELAREAADLLPGVG